jgi:hypothetical protein
LGSPDCLCGFDSIPGVLRVSYWRGAGKGYVGVSQVVGTADVALAFVLAIVALGIPTLVRGRVNKGVVEAAYRAYRILTHGIMAVGILVMLAGDRITWANCATGCLWRTWLALYMLPWWIAAVQPHGFARD